MERFRKLISQFHSLLSHSVQEDLSMKTLVIGEALDLHKLTLPAGFTSCDVAGIASQHYSKVVLRSTLFSHTLFKTYFLLQCLSPANRHEMAPIVLTLH